MNVDYTKDKIRLFNCDCMDFMAEIPDMQIGKAGEYLVCADIIMKGMVAYPSEQGLPYDVVIDNGNRLLKCQVKTTIKPRKVPQRAKESYAYIFNIRRHGKNNKKQYDSKDVDLFALVELERRTVIYISNKDMPSTINIRVDSLRGTYYDEVGISDYNEAIKLYVTIKNKSEIARIMNKQQAVINKYLQPDYNPFMTNARYWSDFIRSKEWIEQI